MDFGGILEKFRRKRAIVWQKFTIFVQYEEVFAGDIGSRAAWRYGAGKSSRRAHRIWRGGGCRLSPLQVRYGSVSGDDAGQDGLCGGHTDGVANYGDVCHSARGDILVPQNRH